MREHRRQIGTIAYWAAVGLVCLTFLAACLHAVANYWQWGHNGFNGASYAQAARNSLRFHVFGQAKYHTGLVPPAADELFTHHPMMIHLHLMALFRLFGYSELVGRLVPALYSFGSLLLLFVIVKRYYGRAMALGSIVAYTLIPLNLIFANMIDHEQGSIFWCLAMIYTYGRWKETLRWGWLAAVVLSTSMSVQWAWPGYYIALVLAIHAFLTGARRQTRVFQWQPEYTFVVVYSVVVLGNFWAFYQWIVDVRGSFDEMMGAFNLRSSTPPEYWKVLLEHTLDLQGPIFVAVLVLWVPYILVRAARGTTHLGDLIPLSFFIAQLIQSLLFKQAGYLHAYWTYHASPTLAVAGAALVLGGARALFRGLREIGEAAARVLRTRRERLWRALRPTAVIASIAFVLVPVAAQARYAYNQFWWGFNTGSAAYASTYYDQFPEIMWAQEVARTFDRRNAYFFVPPDTLHTWRIEFHAYLDSPYELRGTTELPPEALESDRHQVFLFDLDNHRQISSLARFALSHRTMVYDRRFVVVDASDPGGPFEAFVHIEDEPSPLWRWFVNPNHGPVRWVPDPNPSLARALFSHTADVAEELIVGGPGGVPTEWDCPLGYVLDGVFLLSEETFARYVGGLRPHCSPLPLPDDVPWARLTENLMAAEIHEPTFGAPAREVRRQMLSCRPGQAIVGLHGRAGGVPDAVGIICADLHVQPSPAAPGGIELVWGERERSPVFGGDGGGPVEEVCPLGTVGWGFRGRVGNITDAVGISCVRVNPGFWGVTVDQVAAFEDDG